VNRFDAYITYYLYENKEVSLEKIGTLKAPASFAPGEGQTASIEFIYDRKAVTSEGLISFIAEKATKNKNLIASDLESHFSQVREFINIGKSYEMPDVGFIKANKSGVYEFLPYSEANKPVRTTTTQQAKRAKSNNRSAIQLITVLIVIAILVGLSWEAYQYFSKSKNVDTTITNNNNVDTSAANTTTAQDTTNHKTADSIAASPTINYSDSDKVNVKYIFETTESILRAQTRTAQLKSFGNNAAYDSFTNNNNTKFYSLFILKPTKLSDTLRIKDSLAKFFQKDIQVKIAANQ
jgi:hypothetical protein